MLKHCVTPRDVYTEAAVRRHIAQVILKQWGIVAFRPVQPGETYVTVGGSPWKLEMGNYVLSGVPHLIIEPRQPTPPVFTEVVVPERRITMRDVYGCDAQDVLNQAEKIGYEVIAFRKPEPGEETLTWSASGKIESTSATWRSPARHVTLHQYELDLLVRGHCNGIRAIVRKKQAEVDPFA